jgi:hypothetical protein
LRDRGRGGGIAVIAVIGKANLNTDDADPRRRMGYLWDALR